MREVSLVVHKSFLKKKLVEALQQEIVASVPQSITHRKKQRVVGIS